MQMLRPVTVDLATGVVTLGGTRVALQREGEHYVAPGGVRARALTFEERSGVVAGALIDPEPNRALLTKLRNLANVSSDHDDELADALTLALAGGGEPAPSFAECARSACRNASLDWQTVQQTPAVVVDQLATEQETSGGDDGWTRFEFREAPQAEVSLGECCQQMLESLLERGTPQEAKEERDGSGARPWPPQTKLRALSDAVQTDGPNSGRSDTSSPPKFSWPHADQAMQARATLISAEPSSRNTAPTISNSPSTVAGALRAFSGWPQEPSLQVDADVSHSGEKTGAVSAATDPTLGWPDTAQTSVKAMPTMWDRGSQEVRAPWTASAQTLDPAPSRAIAPIAARTRQRAHRLRDLPVSAQKVTQPQRGSSNSQSASPVAQAPTMADSTTAAELLPRSGPLQRDWLYEIATALSDECDLRGLDT